MKKLVFRMFFILILMESVFIIYLNITKEPQQVLEPVENTGCYMATRGSDDTVGYYCDFVGDGITQTIKYDQNTWESLRHSPANAFMVKEGSSPSTNAWLALLASFFILLCYKCFKRSK